MRIFIVLSLLLAATASAQPPRTYPILGKVVRESPRLDALLEPGAQIEMLASGFEWSEGPVWDRNAQALLFSDIPNNAVMKWSREKGVELFLKPAGYTGVASYGREPGSNGLILDSQGRLISMEHGDRRVSIMPPGSGKLTLVDRYEGKRLNSPNDGVLASNGDLYFTDPPYGLAKGPDDPSRELDFCGVYRLSSGKLTLLIRDLTRPNGIAISPDEKTLYVAQSDPQRAIWMAYPILPGGALGSGRIFADVTSMVGNFPGLPDGMKVDRDGNLWATGPGGVHIFAPDGTRLGRLDTGEATANLAWGDDGSTLYITADMYLSRIRTKTRAATW